MSGARAALGRPGAGARTGGTLLICLALVGLLGLLSLAIGSRGLTLSEAWTGLIGHDQTVNSIVVWRLRMPRTILAIVVGACLSVAGVVMQALTRNPLAEPGLLGVNSGAAFAVALARLSQSAGRKLAPEDVLFVDDSPKNVEAATKLGFLGHCFENLEALSAKIEAV